MTTRTNEQIASDLDDARDKLSEVIATLEDASDVEYQNLQTLTQPVLDAIDALSEAVQPEDEDEEEDDGE